MPRLVLITTGLLLLSCNGAPPRPKAEPGPDPRPEAKAGPTAKTTKTDTQTWTFDDLAPGPPPTGFRLAETGGQGTPATWAVVAQNTSPTPPHAFGITESRNDKRTYNLALVEGTAYTDVDLTVTLRAESGELNQGGGPIWRVKDPSNYYIARWDPVEDNAYLYVMQGGVRTALAKVDLTIDHEAWHTLHVVMEGSHMELFIDDEPVLEADDRSLREPGMIGLWTKSDGATLFDDLSVTRP